MAMRSVNSPRRLYKRNGNMLLCFSGRYFGPRSGEKTFVVIDPAREVKIELLSNAGGKRRIRIEQVAAGGASVVETWTEKTIERKKRSSKDDAIGDQLPAPPSAS